MRCAVLVLCALVGGALGNTPTPLERQFAGLRIAIRAGDNVKAKKLLDDGAKKWGKAFTHRQAILSDTLLQTAAEAGNYEIAKDLIVKYDADTDYKDRKGGTAYSFCEKRRDKDEANGDPAGCEPDLWLELVENCLEAKAAGEADMKLSSKYKTAGAVRDTSNGDDGEGTDTPEKQRERLAKYEAEQKAKESMTADDKQREKERKKKEMQERIAEKKRKKAEEAAQKEL